MKASELNKKLQVQASSQGSSYSGKTIKASQLNTAMQEHPDYFLQLSNYENWNKKLQNFDMRNDTVNLIKEGETIRENFKKGGYTDAANAIDEQINSILSYKPKEWMATILAREKTQKPTFVELAYGTSEETTESKLPPALKGTKLRSTPTYSQLLEDNNTDNATPSAEVLKKQDLNSNNLLSVLLTDYDAKAAEIKREKQINQTLKNATVQNNNYRLALNEERAKLELPSLSIEAVEEYNRIYTQNTILPTDDTYDRRVKENNLAQLNLTYQALSAGNFASVTNIGLNKSESDFANNKDLWEIHTTINKMKDNTKQSTDKYALLSEAEKMIWNYYIGKNRFDVAKEYLDTLSITLDVRKAQKTAENLDEQGIWGDIKETGIITANSLYSGIADVLLAPLNIQASTSGSSHGLDDFVFGFNNASFYGEILNSAIMDEGENAFFGTLQKIGSSLAYTAPGMVANAINPALGFEVFLFQGIGSSTKEALRSADNKSSLDDIIYGAIQGSMEFAIDKLLNGITSKIAGGESGFIVKKLLTKIDDLMVQPWVKKALSKLTISVGAGGSESFEEFIQNLSDPIVRCIIYGEQLDYSQETWENIIESAFIGGVAGCLIGGITSKKTYNRFQLEKFGQSIIDSGKIDSLIRLSEDLGIDSEYYERVKKAKEKGKNPNGEDVAQLYRENVKEYNKTMKEADELLIKNVVDAGNFKFVKDIICQGNSEAAKNIFNKYSNMEISETVNTATESYVDYDMPSVILGTAQNYDEVTAIQKHTTNIDGGRDSGYNDNTNQNYNGDDINGSTNAELLAGETVSAAGGRNNSLWQQGANTEKINSLLGDRTGTQETSGQRQAGSEGWLFERFEGTTGETLARNTSFLGNLRRIALKDTDSAGRKLSQDTMDRLQNTVLKTEDGTIISVFHFTDAEFESFARGDIGFHFGTLDAAINRENDPHRKKHGDKRIYKEVYLNITNPVFINFDPTKWNTFSTAHLLLRQGIFTLEDLQTLENLEGFHNGVYGSQAVTELNKLIKNKGYDGIIYINAVEGDLSVIALDPDQIITVAENGILKENSGVAEPGYNHDNSGNDLQDALGITELSAANPKTDYIEDFVAQMAGVQNLTDEQQSIRSIGRKLGWNVVFAPVTTPNGVKSDGKIIFGKKTIVINPDSKKPIQFILKHELAHSLEQDLAAYSDFANAVMDSRVFKDYVKSQGFNSTTEYNADIVQRYKSAGVEGFDSSRAEHKANCEMVANFVGDCLFGGNTKITAKLLEAINPAQKKSFIQWAKGFFTKIKNKLSGKHKQLTDEISALENKFLETVQAVEAKENTVTQDGVADAYSINEDFYSEFDAWDGKDTNKVFTIGTTSEALKSVNIKNQEIKMRSGMILQKLSKHPEMSKEIFRNIPDLLEKPIIVQFSDAIDPKTGKPKYDSRITLLGELYAEMVIDGKTVQKPVLVSLELLPTNQKKTKILDVSFVTSAYGHSKLQSYLNDNSILYIEPNKKRTNKWLSLNRLQLPLGENRTGPIRKITYADGKVKIQNSKNATAMQLALEKSGVINSYGNSIFNGSGNDTPNESFSISEKIDIDSVLDAVSKGEMTKEEAKELLSSEKTLTPYDIANLPKSSADTTGGIGKPKRVGNGNKQSKFYASALGSDIITPEVKEEIEADTYIKNYQGTTNKKTLNMAAKELEEGGQARVNEFKRLEAEKASAVDVAVGLILLEGYQRAGNLDGALEIAEKLREIGTAAGQTVQIFSIIGRYTPEMMQVYAQKELDKAYEALVKAKTQKWVDKRKDSFKLTDEDIEFIRRRTLQAAMLEDGTRQKAVLLAEICTRVQDKIPPEAGQSLRALQRISLLLNVRTNLRNVLGNANMAGVFIASDFFGSLLDKQLAKSTGIRTTGNFQLKGSVAAFKKGLAESYDDFKRGIRTKQDELNRYDVNHGGGKNFNEHHKKLKQLDEVAKALNKLDNFTSFCLEAGDRSFFEMWFQNSLNNQLRLNNVEIPTPQMIEIAREEALQRTWQNNNTVSRTMTRLKNTLNKAHIPFTSYGFGDFVLKFVKTPANIGKAMVEFSPIGFAPAIINGIKFKDALDTGRLTPQMQKEFVRSMSNAFTGTVIYVLVAVLANAGLIELSGDGDDDKDVSNFEKYIVGVAPYSMEVFGVDVTYSWNQPMGTIFATVANAMDSKKDGVDTAWYEDTWNAFKAGATVFTEQSFLSSLYELFSAEDIATGIAEAFLSEPSAFIPQLSSQLASFTDPYARTTYENGQPIQSAINSIIYKIPGLRKTLPKRVDILGEDVKNNQYLNPWNAFANPSTAYPESSGKVAEQIYELYKETEDKSVMPRTAPNKLTIKGNSIAFTAEEKAEFQRNIGTRSVNILEVMFESEDYKALSSEEKAEAVSKVYEYAYAKAKCELDVYDYTILSAMEGEDRNGNPILDEELYNRLDDKAKQILVDEYFLSKAERRCKDDTDKLAELFIKKAKE